MNHSIQEWLTPASLSYLSECLQACQSPEMLADLRAIAPPQALKQATKRLSAKKREQIKEWVLVLNSASEVAA
jgi:hypothetical protein